MIKYKEFKIKVTKKGGMLSNPVFEPVKETLLRMNNWIEEKEIMVLNVETLFIPHSSTRRGEYNIPGGGGVSWHQIFRVWYQ